MTSFLKAIFPGGLVTWLVAMFIGSSGSKGGALAVYLMPVYTYEVYWSWPLMFALTGLGWAIFLMME